MFELRKETVALLEDIENRIDPEVEDQYRKEWMDFLHGRFEGECFDPVRAKKAPSSLAQAPVHINDAIEDLDLMISTFTFR